MLLVALALGCGATAPPPAPAGPVVELPAASAEPPPEDELPPLPAGSSASPEQMLADDHATRFPKRVQLALRHHARFRVDATDLVLEEPHEVYTNQSVHVAVGEAAMHVRIVTESGNLRLLTWVPKDELVTVVRTPTRLGTRPDASDGARVFPGLPLKVSSRSASTSEVSHESQDRKIWGFVSAKAIGHVYVPLAESAWLGLTGDASLASGTSVSATPGGAAIAKFDNIVHVELLGKPEAGQQRIRVRELADSTNVALGGFELEGWVPVASVQTPPQLGNMTGYGSSGGWGGSHVVYIFAGTRFFDAPSGELVGIATGEMMGYRAPDQEGWLALEVNTPWGFTTLFAPPETEPPR